MLYEREIDFLTWDEMVKCLAPTHAAAKLIAHLKLIIAGDFGQLPAVKDPLFKANENKTFENRDALGCLVGWCKVNKLSLCRRRVLNKELRKHYEEYGRNDLIEAADNEEIEVYYCLARLPE